MQFLKRQIKAGEMEGFWFSKHTGLKYQVINVIRNNVFVRDYRGQIGYEDIDVFIANYQKFREVAND